MGWFTVDEAVIQKLEDCIQDYFSLARRYKMPHTHPLGTPCNSGCPVDDEASVCGCMGEMHCPYLGKLLDKAEERIKVLEIRLEQLEEAQHKYLGLYICPCQRRY